MNPISGAASMAAVQSQLVRSTDSGSGDTATAVSLLKKSLQADKSMVETLLAPTKGMLDIKA